MDQASSKAVAEVSAGCGGADRGGITKGGTKVYREITITGTDARFANGPAGDADFQLDSRAPNGVAGGNEWASHITRYA